MRRIRMIVIGAGSRGGGYAAYATQYPEQVQIVGVAEPRESYRESLARQHNIPRESVAKDWRSLVDRPAFADAVIIATPDPLHEDPAVAFAEKGYHLLLEKPMAQNEQGCRRVVDATLAQGVILAVCHVLLYTRYTRTIKSLIDSRVIGDIVNIQRLEPVGYWHQAHSFVRGNWRNEAESTFMLLAKSSHDLDWIRHIIGERCRAVSSFGSLKHFRRENKPASAANRCTDCDYEPQCPYSAIKIYLGRVKAGQTGWPVDVLTPVATEESILAALRDSRYGRCVYDCDNDVVDNQVVNMIFESGATASFTMTAFNQAGHRETRIFGTAGELEGDGSIIRHFDFLTDRTEVIDTNASDASIIGGHGGGDYGLMQSFVAAVAANDPSKVLSGPQEALESHLMVFAAERARRENRVVNMQPRKGDVS